MAVTNFLPEIWSARLLSALQTRHVTQAITNRDYEGDVTPGGTVNITSIADPTIDDYTGADFTFEEMTDATRALVINQKKFFAFQLDDVDRAQAVNGGALLDSALERATYKLADTMDQYVLGAINAAALGGGHTVGEETVTDPADAYNWLVEFGVLLDGADVPDAGRWAIVSPSFYGLLLKDQRFIGTGDAAAAATRANGRVGQAAGFSIYKSNNLPDSTGANTNPVTLAGSVIATTVAEQIDKVEAVRLQNKFGDGVKGLHVYGAKVLRAEALVTADIIVG